MEREGSASISADRNSLMEMPCTPSTSISGASFCVSALRKPNSSCSDLSNSCSGISSTSSFKPHRALMASSAASTEPRRRRARRRSSSRRRGGETAARPQRSSPSVTVAAASHGSRTRSKIARCSSGWITQTRLRHSANWLKLRGCCIMSSPGGCMADTAAHIEGKPRHRSRLRKASRQRTGATISIPLRNSSRVRVPSLFSSRRS
mmetsp:Transcript_51220/g.119495  ORF Transcript_51220/g.119495 Transcript_51220/m.119495 type:complete len:206 (-) Transcript_51220:204-821(-)